MRNIFVITLMLFSLLAFSQGENKTDAKGRKQGEWKKYHENGILRYVGKFKNDKPVGVFKYYYDSGNVQVKMTYFGAEAYTSVYYKTGELKGTGKYINQKKDSTWTYYDVDGYKKATEFYVMGLKDKIWYVYFTNGQIAEEKEYSNDFENGIWNQYFENGKKKLEATFKNGGLEGKAVYYKENGKRGVSGYFSHGVRNGVWLYFEVGGNKIKKKEIYKDGIRIDKDKEDNIDDPNKFIPIDEDFLQPENFTSPK